MKDIKVYFLSNPTISQVFSYAIIILSIWLTELIVLVVSWKGKLKHTLTNLLFIATALPVQLFMTIFVLMVTSWGAVFHLVHHIDLPLDVSTSVREHPAETFLRMCFLVFCVCLIGASLGALLL